MPGRAEGGEPEGRKEQKTVSPERQKGRGAQGRKREGQKTRRGECTPSGR